MDPVEIRFRWDEEHFVRALRLYFRGMRSQRYMTWFVWAFTAVLLWLAFRSATETHSGLGWRLFYTGFYVFLAIVMMCVRGPLQMFWIRRRFRSRPDQQRDVRYVIDDEGIHGETEGLSKSDILWAMPQSALVSNDALIVFLTPRQYQYIPLDEGLTDADRERLIALVEKKLPEVKRL
jgi:hypothetical protein